MTEVTFKGKKLKLVLNMYRLYCIANDLEAETPAQALDAVNEVLTRPEGEVISTSGMKGFVTIFRNMAEEGTPGFKMTDSELFDILNDDASAGVVEEFFKFLPPAETQKKNNKAEEP